MNKQSPPETLQSLLKYEYKAGQTQKFLDRVGMNFRWPSSMPEYLRRDAFIKIFDVDLEEDEKVIEYGDEYNDDELNSVFEIMPNAIQLPVDPARLLRSKPAKMVRIRIRRPNDNNIIVTFSYDFYDILHNKKYTCVVDTGAPNTILPHHARRILGRKGWSRVVTIARGYVVQAKILLWESDPGDQVEYALVGNDVTDQLAYIYEPGNLLKFLNLEDETRLTMFLNGCTASLKEFSLSISSSVLSNSSSLLSSNSLNKSIGQVFLGRIFASVYFF
ncbi:18497_t:CDS:2 [Gigaspora rosea]|nr:18497_t:CDS:2 [Gigaspora rosea]